MSGNINININQQTNTPSSMHSQPRTPQMQGITPPMRPLPRPQNVKNIQYPEQEIYTPITPQSPNETDQLFGGNAQYQRLNSNRSDGPSSINTSSINRHNKQVSFNLPVPNNNNNDKKTSEEDGNISSVTSILTR